MKIIYFMGKSASGKDTVYKKIKEQIDPKPLEVVLYTTRPRRDNEENGREYYFVTKDEIRCMEREGKVIEKRIYNTVYGEWIYMTADDGQFKRECNYIAIGTLESYVKIKKYFGEEVMIPVYLEVEDGMRLERAIEREKTQKVPKYEEMCRRFLADQQDFSEEKLEEAGIRVRFHNEDVCKCIQDIKEYLYCKLLDK